MAKKRDIDNAKLEEMISNPAIAALYETFEFTSPETDKEARREELREKIKNKMNKRLREAEGEDEDEEFSEEDFLDDDMGGDEFADEEFSDEDFMDEEEGPADVQGAIDVAQDALDDIENFVAGEVTDEIMDDEYGDDEYLDDDIFIDDEDESGEEDATIEERRKMVRKRVREAIKNRRAMREAKKEDKEDDEEEEKEDKKKKDKVKELRTSILKGRATLKAIEEKRARVYQQVRKSLKENGKRHSYTQKGIKVHTNLKAKEARLKEAIKVLRVELREELYSTGGKTPGQQVKFPGMPKKTQTGIQKQKNTKTEYPKKAKGPQKGNIWPTHGSASNQKGEAVKGAGKFPGKEISRMSEARRRAAIKQRVREAIAKRNK
ncbi:MAG: hypothetical protein LC687_00435 [Actinobacteria bacterium]|nr:hypothetical protein [Actinomycetota bacterium]MCA1806337.1 hypothetical protein [Actinomycetota bacterium]